MIFSFQRSTKANIELNIRRVCYSFQNFLSQINSSCPTFWPWFIQATATFWDSQCFIRRLISALVSESNLFTATRAGIRSSSIKWSGIFALYLPYISKSSCGIPVWLLFQLLVWCGFLSNFNIFFINAVVNFNLKNHFFHHHFLILIFNIFPDKCKKIIQIEDTLLITHIKPDNYGLKKWFFKLK